MLKTSKAKITLFSILGAVVVLAAALLIYASLSGGSGKSGYTDPATGDLVIPAGELSEKATFYPYEADGIKMEVLALKTSDGKVRTAFNTCQVCYSSGRGYYELDGTTLVCQNCGNRFAAEQVEQEQGGCNPVPITPEYKEEKDGNIVISKEFLQQASVIFESWKQ